MSNPLNASTHKATEGGSPANQDGFLKDLFEKNPSVLGEAANLANFTDQAQATNIQPTTLSLIFSIAFYAASMCWENFASQFLTEFGDIYEGSYDMLDESSDDEIGKDEDDLSINTPIGLKIPPNPVLDTPPILPDIVMTLCINL
ncbi:hypothetical protein RhiirA4_483310 [Rhizophagus irregularis]|uniref:Uncharacterized protein n=1 Tax=Rhizophagus irregularis TaxID=588596 RepID=A0A2I1HME1_9GLOM|nr:hypothetical protein RhiirA4_483310 [Rhizophagus irregularis]